MHWIPYKVEIKLTSAQRLLLLRAMLLRLADANWEVHPFICILERMHELNWSRAWISWSSREVGRIIKQERETERCQGYCTVGQWPSGQQPLSESLSHYTHNELETRYKNHLSSNPDQQFLPHALYQQLFQPVWPSHIWVWLPNMTALLFTPKDRFAIFFNNAHVFIVQLLSVQTLFWTPRRP